MQNAESKRPSWALFSCFIPKRFIFLHFCRNIFNFAQNKK